MVFTSPGPVIFEIGPIAIRWYGLLIAIAVLSGLTLARYLAKKRYLDPDLMDGLIVWLIIGAIPIARLYYVAFEWNKYRNQLDQVVAIWKGGIAIHGAIIGGLLATLIFAYSKNLCFWVLTDVLAPPLILGQAIGRWGNFFNSEAFGDPTDLPWKLYIPESNRPAQFRAYDYFHPTFLYESIWNLGVFALLMFLFPKRLKNGTIFMVYLVAYSVGRFWIEGLRTDSLMLGYLRIAQVVSVLAIILGITGLAWLYIFKRRLPDVVLVDSLEKKKP